MNQDGLSAAVDQTAQQPNPAAMLVVSIIYLGIIALYIVAAWRVYAKAGQPGWAALVPVYNIVVWLRIIQRPAWWTLMMFIPVVNIFFVLIASVDTARAFGKGTGYGLGLFFLNFIFWPMLAFGDAKYVGGTAEAPKAMAMAA
ncbi:MAG: DUF5684 domain-containing protein [Myxococcaceae bacterium]|nr:DUF5684 domain-containing protein [Myxococcaceae bacterium]MCI0672591.1 DUF5684 domain-containing protein [Myxococcaceae bacterium]